MRSILSKLHNNEPIFEFVKAQLEPLELSREEEHVVIARMKKLAKDPEESFVNALELVHRSYESQDWERQHTIGDLVRPAPSDRKAWETYQEMIQLAVSLLSKFRGSDGEWRTVRYDTVPTNYRASMGSMAAAKVVESVVVEWDSLKELGIILETVSDSDDSFRNNGLFKGDIDMVASKISRDVESMGFVVAEGEVTDTSTTLHVYDSNAVEIDSAFLVACWD